MGEVEALLVRSYSDARRRLNTAPEPIVIKYVCIHCERESDAPLKPVVKPTIRHIIRAVSALEGISENDIKSDRRTAPLVHARQIVMYLARYYTSLSTTQVGRALGGRDHTTVIHGVRKIAGMKLNLSAYEKLWGEHHGC